MGSRIASRALLSKSFASSLVSCSSPSLAARVCLLRPLAATAFSLPSGAAATTATGLRCFSTRRTESSLNDPSPNWSNRPPKETILLDGCDFEHWLCVMEPPEDPNATRDDIIDSYIKTLATVVGSEEEARMKIYSVSTRCYYAFGALVSEEVSLKIKELQKVRWVLPDSYLDVKNKDYGGEPFINGQAVPYDNKYHEEWIRNNNRANERNRRNDRPRNLDRSRNFERRGNMQAQGENGPPPPTQSRPPNSNMPPGQNNMQPPRMQDMQRPPMQNNMQNTQPPPMQNNMQPIQPPPMQNNMQPPHMLNMQRPPMQNNMQRPPMPNIPPPPMQQNPAQNNNMVPPPMYNPAPGMQQAPNNGSFNQAATFRPVQNSEANAPGMQQPPNNGSFNLAATSRSVQNSEPNAPGMQQPPNNGSFNPAASFRPVQNSEPNPGWSNNSQGIVPSYQNTVPGRGYNEANAPNYPHRNDQELPYNQGPPGSGNVYQS